MTTASAIREEVLSRMVVTNGPWVEVALSHFFLVPGGTEGTGEDFRLALLDLGVPEPAHHNAWGAMMNAAVRRRMLTPTGEYRPMQTLKSHARSTPVYRRAGRLLNPGADSC